MFLEPLLFPHLMGGPLCIRPEAGSFLGSFQEVLGLFSLKRWLKGSSVVFGLSPPSPHWWLPIQSFQRCRTKKKKKRLRQCFVDEGIRICWKAENFLPFLVSFLILLVSLTSVDLLINIIHKRFYKKLCVMPDPSEPII